MKSMLYHLSVDNHDKEIFKPSIPGSPLTDYDGTIIEDITTPRICFSKFISGCVLALTNDSENVVYKEFYVHIPKNIEDWYDENGGNWFEHIHVPTQKQVPDAKFTYERWVIHPVEMKCIGKIKVNLNIKKHISTNYRTSWRPKVNFKWIEKYD